MGTSKTMRPRPDESRVYCSCVPSLRRNIKPVMTLVEPSGSDLSSSTAQRRASRVSNERDAVRIPRETCLTPGEASDGLRRAVPGLADAALRVEAEQEDDPEDEEDDQCEDRRPVGPGDLEHHAEQQRPEPGGAALGRVVEAEVLTFTAAGDQQAEEGPRQRLGAAQHDPDGEREQVEEHRLARR